MTRAADVIAALNQRRLLKARRPESPGTLPGAWQRWLDAEPRLDRSAAGAPPESWVDVFSARPLRERPRRAPELGPLQAMASLLRQEWEPETREDRGMRVAVGVLDLVLHVLFLVALLWLMYARFLAMSQATEQDDGAVQVEFIGRGNVEAGGGAPASEGAESGPDAAATPSLRPGLPAATAAATPVPDSSAGEAMSTPEPVEARPAQILRVTEVAVPDPDAFQLPPPTPRTLDVPQAELREAQPRQVQEVATLSPQAVRERSPVVREAELREPQLRAQPREVPVLEPLPPTRERSLPQVAQRVPDVPQPRAQVRDIPMPAGGPPSPPAASSAAGTTAAPSTGAGGARGSAPTSGQSPAGSGQGARPASEGGRGVAATGAGAGPAARPAPGGWPGPARSDDWGASSRTAAGTGAGAGSGRPGLYNDDGSVRLSDDWAQARGVNPDQSGQWLARPGLEYRGTRFDRYWIPEGTLLQEWVRRGIKKIAIPIPGTNTRLECVVSLLQLGGGCFPVNPDMNEQPATARPPPDVPFKPGLQEDNGSVQPVP